MESKNLQSDGVKKLKFLTSEEILALLPHKLQVRFAYECCLEIKDKIKDPRSLKALEVIGRWLRDEATQEEMENVANAAANAANATYATYAAKAAAYAAFNAAKAAANADNAAFNAAFNAAKAAAYATKDKLLKFIDNLSEIEKVLYFGQL